MRLICIWCCTVYYKDTYCFIYVHDGEHVLTVYLMILMFFMFIAKQKDITSKEDTIETEAIESVRNNVSGTIRQRTSTGKDKLNHKVHYIP